MKYIEVTLILISFILMYNQSVIIANLKERVKNLELERDETEYSLIEYPNGETK